MAMLDQRISIAQSPHSPQPDDWDGEPRKVASRGGSNLLQKNTGRRELDWWFDIGFLNTYVFRTDDDDDVDDDDDDDMVLFSGHDSWLIVVFWLMIRSFHIGLESVRSFCCDLTFYRNRAPSFTGLIAGLLQVWCLKPLPVYSSPQKDGKVKSR
jgi:hypothetical protein